MMIAVIGPKGILRHKCKYSLLDDVDNGGIHERRVTLDGIPNIVELQAFTYPDGGDGL